MKEKNRFEGIYRAYQGVYRKTQMKNQDFIWTNRTGFQKLGFEGLGRYTGYLTNGFLWNFDMLYKCYRKAIFSPFCSNLKI